MKSILKALIFLALPACVTPEAALVSDQHTGQTIAYASGTNAYTGLFDWLKVRPFHSDKSGYGVETIYSNYGWIFPREVWSNGQQYNYVETASDTALCGGAGGCITLERGIIRFSEQQFRKAAQAGFEFKLVGTKGAVVGTIPATQFAEVLALAGRQ